MDKIIRFLDKYFVPYAAKIASNIYLQAIRDGLMMSMPLIIIGSLFLIIGNLPIPGYAQFMQTLFGETWKLKLSYAVDGTFSLLGIFVSLGVGYRLSEKFRLDAITVSMISFSSYMIMSPYKINFFSKELNKVINIKGINLDYVGSKGMFVAIIMAILTVQIVNFFVKKGIVIKMPDSVPPAVAQSFSALIPALAVITLSLILRIVLETTSWENIHNLVNVLVSKPLSNLGGSYIGALFQTLFITILWSVGLHGSSIVSAVMYPVWLSMADQNRIAFQAGLELPNIVTFDFFYFSAKMGGAGSTIMLVIFMTFFAKSKHLKEIGKLSLVPGIFNINEPVIFGVPIVLNPILFIPFITAPLVATTTTYFAMVTGIVPKLTGVTLPWTTPVGVYGFLATNGSLAALVLTVLNLTLIGMIYYPFFKLFDKQQSAAEFEEEKIQEIKEKQISGDTIIV